MGFRGHTGHPDTECSRADLARVPTHRVFWYHADRRPHETFTLGTPARGLVRNLLKECSLSSHMPFSPNPAATPIRGLFEGQGMHESHVS